MQWNTRAQARAARLARAAQRLGNRLAGKHVEPEGIGELLLSAIEPGDRVCIASEAHPTWVPTRVGGGTPVRLGCARARRRGAAASASGTPRGQKLVVQMVETFREHMQPAFVETLDAWQLAEQVRMALPPLMIYGEDVSHLLTEEGIANLLICRTDDQREQAIRGVAGYTPVGLGRDRRMVKNLRDRGVIRRPEDLGIDPREATRNLLAARSVRDLVRASGGLYQPPSRFRNW